MQYLTVDNSKPKNTEFWGSSEFTAESNRSKFRRSHSPLVTLEAMPSNEARAAGVGFAIRYGIHATPFGELLIATTPRGICNLHFVEADKDAEQPLRTKWKNAAIVHDPSATRGFCDRLFASTEIVSQASIPLWVKGTEFQLQVWRALLTIPFGQVTTYQAIANTIEKPSAARAVGNAIGQNPIAYLIPCHRVIRESGALGGYYWGLERKAAILAWEAQMLAS